MASIYDPNTDRCCFSGHGQCNYDYGCAYWCVSSGSYYDADVCLCLPTPPAIIDLACVGFNLTGEATTAC